MTGQNQVLLVTVFQVVVATLSCGVPQGSDLDPILFAFSMP